MTDAIRVAVLSDLHNEFERNPQPGRPAGHPAKGPDLAKLEDIDFLVLAGDIDVGTAGIGYADQAARFLGKPCFYIKGNHENYHNDLVTIDDEIRAAAAKTDGRVTYLENEKTSIEMRGQRIDVLGCCLWTDFKGSGRAFQVIAKYSAKATFNCFNAIRLGGRAVMPDDMENMFESSMSWLRPALEESRKDADVTIVVTHFAPLPASSSPIYASDLASNYMFSDLSGFIGERGPNLWIYGHTHFENDRTIGETRVVSNQRGYVGIEKSAFGYKPKIVEITPKARHG